MDIASMVLGIISLVFSIFCGCITVFTAPVGLVLGIVDLVKKKDNVEAKKGMAVAGVAMCSISIVIIIALFAFIGSSGFKEKYLKGYMDGRSNLNSSYEYDYNL